MSEGFHCFHGTEGCSYAIRLTDELLESSSNFSLTVRAGPTRHHDLVEVVSRVVSQQSIVVVVEPFSLLDAPHSNDEGTSFTADVKANTSHVDLPTPFPANQRKKLAHLDGVSNTSLMKVHRMEDSC